jgi:iron complex outermembrane recepter protein
MKTQRYLSVIFLLSVLSIIVQAQTVGVITGLVTDIESKEPLPGATIVIKGTAKGTVTDTGGMFNLKVKEYPVTLSVSLIGFRSLEVGILGELEEDLVIQLSSGTLLAQEVVVTASPIGQSILESSMTIERMDMRAMKETPSPSFYDALENVKGVQMTTSSITFKVPNTRGFNIPNNFRFVQVVDGVDMQAGTLGVPLGNAIGPTELDIESVEITPGAASAVYGMNAINGMANLITKNPFRYQGLSIYQRTGVNHIDGIDYDPAILTETAIRYAYAFNARFAFKINVSYFSATDWRGNTITDQNPNSSGTANRSFPELNVADHPAYDAWNKYGDDGGSNAVTINGVDYLGNPNQSFLVRRTGYWERELVPAKADNKKFDAALHYRVNPHAELSYTFRYGMMDGLFQRGNKIQLDNTFIRNHKLELKGIYYMVRSYISIEDTGDSYNLKPLSDNLDLTHASNATWAAAFKSELQTQLYAGVDLAQAMHSARLRADQGRAEPGTSQFNELKASIIKINNWDHVNAGVPTGTTTGGARLKQRSRMYHTDAVYDLAGKVRFADILIGGDVRIYEVIPDGNNFVDFKRSLADRTVPLGGGNFGENVYYSKFGVFAQLARAFFDEKLKLTGSLRYDRNLEFEPRLNPRIAAQYTVAEKHSFRLSYQNGFRFPSLFEALSFVNNGNIRRVGGLPFINEGLNYLDNSYTLASVTAFNTAIRTDEAAGMERTAAALKNRGILQETNLSPTRPERIDSFEAGYKMLLLDDKLSLDVDVYSNVYDGFLGQVEVSVPYLPSETNPAVPGEQVTIGTDEAVIAMIQQHRNSRQARYRVFTNAKNKYRNYGSAFATTYNFHKQWIVSTVVNYNAISNNNEPDVFVTGFNTPNWSWNVSVSNRQLFGNVGFNILYRRQKSFLWESPLANGIIPAFGTLDAQVNLRLPSIKSTVKVGGTNILNDRYIQYAAGPSIAGLYYVSVTVDGLTSGNNAMR